MFKIDLKPRTGIDKIQLGTLIYLILKLKNL